MTFLKKYVIIYIEIKKELRTIPHIVKCLYCGETFDRDKIEFEQVSSRRYAHKLCAAAYKTSQEQEDIDKKNLENYIKHLLKTDYISPKVRKQIKTFVEEYHYTYSGIHKALVYFYEVKGNNSEKANGGIGIVPYCYQDAYNYYYALWVANQRNENKVISEYKPVEIIVRIPPPERKIRKRRMFSFLEDDV